MQQAQELDDIFAKSGPVGPLHGRQCIFQSYLTCLPEGLPMSIKDNICVRGSDSTVGVAKNCFIARGESSVIHSAQVTLREFALSNR